MGQVSAAGIYARISNDDDGLGAGVERQIRDCKKLARDLRWPVADTYVDNDVSAYSGKRRPEFERLLADAVVGSIDAVAIYHTDRLTRSPKDTERFLDAVTAARIVVRFVVGDMDLGTDDGVMILRLFTTLAAHESATKSRRVKRKMIEVAESGMPHGGSIRPFAYEADRMTIRTDEAKILKKVVARFLAGESLRSLAIWLNDSGIRTTSGGIWDTQSLRYVVSNPRYAGLRALNRIVVGKAAWKPILTDDQHRRILLRLEEIKVSGRRPNRRYLLSGMLRCGRCNNRLFSAARKDARRYVCTSGPDHGGCGRLTVVAAPVEQLIADAVLYRLDTPELARALAGIHTQDAELAELSANIAADKDQLEELAQVYAARHITVAEWMTARKPIEARIEAAERRLAHASNHSDLLGVIGKGSALRTQWPTFNLDRQTAVVKAVLDHAVIGPGRPGARALDPARVRPVWRL